MSRSPSGAGFPLRNGPTTDEPSFPVGYHRQHRKESYNFTLNCWYSVGLARLEDMREAEA